MKGKRIGLFVTSSVQSRTAWAASGRRLYCCLTHLTGQATNFRAPSGHRPLLLHYDIECRRPEATGAREKLSLLFIYPSKRLRGAKEMHEGCKNLCEKRGFPSLGR